MSLTVSDIAPYVMFPMQGLLEIPVGTRVTRMLKILPSDHLAKYCGTPAVLAELISEKYWFIMLSLPFDCIH